MAQPTVSGIDPGQRFRMAGQLDEIVRELQVLQHTLRVGEGTMPLATVSTGLIGAKITLTEVIDTLGAVEGNALSDIIVHPDSQLARGELTGAEKRFYGIEA